MAACGRGLATNCTNDTNICHGLHRFHGLFSVHSVHSLCPPCPKKDGPRILHRFHGLFSVLSVHSSVPSVSKKTRLTKDYISQLRRKLCIAEIIRVIRAIRGYFSSFFSSEFILDLSIQVLPTMTPAMLRV